MNNKRLGLLYGQYIGDALGGRYEFSSKENATNKIKTDTVDNFVPILGQGPHKLKPGQVTDDTEMAAALYNTIVKEGQYYPNKIVGCYHDWYRTGPFDIGNTILTAISDINSNYKTTVHISEKYNSKSLSNGSLMRISLVALLPYTLDLLKLIAEVDCKITHSNQIAIDANIVYMTALYTALRTNNKHEILNTAMSVCKTNVVKEILFIAQNKKIYKTPVYYGKDMKYVMPDSQQSGYLGIALHHTFYELLHGDNFHDSLINIISKGGDTDTNACIAGSLLGAYYGKNEIPLRWIDSVTNTVNDRKELTDITKIIKSL